MPDHIIINALPGAVRDPGTIVGIPAVTYTGDEGIVQVARVGIRTLIRVSRHGHITDRTFIGTAGIAEFLDAALTEERHD